MTPGKAPRRASHTERPKARARRAPYARSVSQPGPQGDQKHDRHEPQDGREPAGRSRRRGDRIAGPFDALHIMTAGDATKADEALERLMDSDSVEDQIVLELTRSRPLAQPRRFPAAHRDLMRALEIYDRNARRRPTRLPIGLLRPVLSPVVALMAGMISRAYQKRLITDVRRLYVMREANSAVGTAEHRMLVTARRQVDQLSPDLAGKGFAIPAFLIGGALLSAVTSALQDLLHSGTGRLALLGAVLLLTIAAFWCILAAAAVTRRRTRLVLDEPLATLWTAIGAAGVPPRDPSRAFVAVATILLVLGWIIAPLVAALVSQFL